MPGAIPANLLNLQPADLDLLYNGDQCDDRHPITGGMASSPFFIAPEIAVRIGRAFSLGLFSRLQVVTGSKVYRGDDPTASKDFNEAFANIYGSDNTLDPLNGGVVVPQGEQHKPPFSWALGIKAKYFFGKDDKRFRVFLGGFTGYGQARLRVPMGFANDHSGNSIPDDQEVPCDVPLGSPDIVCGGNPDAVPVWPYNRSTQNDATGQGEVQRAITIQQNADRAERIDTVVIGQGFVGILVGFNFQVVKNFAIFAELDIGAWFPNTTSGLFDLVLGPAITF